MRTDIDFDVYIERTVGRHGSGGQVREHCRVVDEDAHGGRPREFGQPLHLAWRHDFIGDQHIGDSRSNKGRRLVHLLAADTDRTARDLRLGDVGTLVRLGMWT